MAKEINTEDIKTALEEYNRAETGGWLSSFEMDSYLLSKNKKTCLISVSSKGKKRSAILILRLYRNEMLINMERYVNSDSIMAVRIISCYGSSIRFEFKIAHSDKKLRARININELIDWVLVER